MNWRFKVEAEGRETRITGRDTDGRRHDAVMAEGDPPRLTLLGDGPHHPCRLAEAVGIGAALLATDPGRRRGEIAARRMVAVGAPLDWRSRLQAAAELDRLSGIVFDELMDRGAHPGEVGLAPALHLSVAGEAAAGVWLGTEAEMRADLAEERRRRRGIEGDIRGIGGGFRGIEVGETVMIEALAIAAYAPFDEGEVAPPAPEEIRRLDLTEVAAEGAGVVRFAGMELVIDYGWSVAAEGGLLRLRRIG